MRLQRKFMETTKLLLLNQKLDLFFILQTLAELNELLLFRFEMVMPHSATMRFKASEFCVPLSFSQHSPVADFV